MPHWPFIWSRSKPTYVGEHGQCRLCNNPDHAPTSFVASTAADPRHIREPVCTPCARLANTNKRFDEGPTESIEQMAEIIAGRNNRRPQHPRPRHLPPARAMAAGEDSATVAANHRGGNSSMTNNSQPAGSDGFTEQDAAEAGHQAVRNFNVRGDEPPDQVRADIRNMLHSALVASLDVSINVAKDNTYDTYDHVSLSLPLSETLHASYQSARDATRMSKALVEDAQQADDSVRAGLIRQMAFEWAIAALECYANTAAHYLELMERQTVRLQENGVATKRNRADVFAVVRQLHSAMMNAAQEDLKRRCYQSA